MQQKLKETLEKKDEGSESLKDLWQRTPKPYITRAAEQSAALVGL